MFRNQYDNDITTWSPQGRLLQVEYAMEAVKQGSATVGLKNKTHAVLVALKRSTYELSAHQKKISPVDHHVGIAYAGLTADARVLSRFMKNECTNERWSHDRNLPIGRLVEILGKKMQTNTQRYDRRPFGVGLLIAGYDDNGPHIYETCPSADYFDCKSMAIGARSQSARTYLEKHLDKFFDTTLEELVKHGLVALRDCLPNDLELNTKNVSIAIVGKGYPFTIFDDDSVGKWLELLTPAERKGRGSGSGSGAGAAAEGSESRPDDPQPPPEPRPADPSAEAMSID